MSGGTFCVCPLPSYSRWVVIQRHCNHSAFSGYRRTPSAYSSVHCIDCGRVWRTKAGYVSKLRDIGEDGTKRVLNV